MIQQTNARQRHLSANIAGVSDGPEVWGQWSGRKYYSLQVVQHPLRARMCGFGDKDRRPLAPAAVAKMIVRRDDNSLVDVDEIDCSFFLVTVDLWSADGKQEMNLVLHPSSADRYVPPHSQALQSTVSPIKSRRRATTSSMPPPASSSSSSSNPNSSMPSTPGVDSLSTSFAPATPHTWGYPSWPQNENSHDLGYRPWNASNHDPNVTGWGQHQAYDPTDYSVPQGHTMYGPPSVPSMGPSSIGFPHSHSNFPPTVPSSSSSIPPSPAPIPLPRHTYTRTLVGPLSANATRLLDEHRKPGIFYLFQDLSVRTEGTFRLRMRLMNVGRFPAPEAGATGVMSVEDDDGRGGVSPVLAQVFTEPFTVYSAKRFPGVPDTTALSIAFGNQGQKLPLRNRHGSTSGKRRRRAGDDESDESD